MANVFLAIKRYGPSLGFVSRVRLFFEEHLLSVLFWVAAVFAHTKTQEELRNVKEIELAI